MDDPLAGQQQHVIQNIVMLLWQGTSFCIPLAIYHAGCFCILMHCIGSYTMHLLYFIASARGYSNEWYQLWERLNLLTKIIIKHRYVISLEYLPYEISRIVNCFSSEHTVMLRSSDNTVSYTHFKIPTWIRYVHFLLLVLQCFCLTWSVLKNFHVFPFLEIWPFSSDKEPSLPIFQICDAHISKVSTKRFY